MHPHRPPRPVYDRRAQTAPVWGNSFARRPQGGHWDGAYNQGLVNPPIPGAIPGQYNPGFTPQRAGSRIEEVFSEHGTPMHPLEPMDGTQYMPEHIDSEGTHVPLQPDGEPSLTFGMEGRPRSQFTGSHAGPPSTVFEHTPSLHHHSSTPYNAPFGTTPANSVVYSPNMESVVSRRSRSHSRPRSVLSARVPFRRRSGSFSDDEDIILMVDDNANIEIGTEREGLVPYRDYLRSHDYRTTRGGRSYCVIPAGTPIIFQDENGNEISRMGGRRRHRSRYRSRHDYDDYVDDHFDDDPYHDRRRARSRSSLRYYSDSDSEYPEDRGRRRGRSYETTEYYTRSAPSGPVIHLDTPSARLLRAVTPTRMMDLMGRVFRGNSRHGRRDKDTIIYDNRSRSRSYSRSRSRHRKGSVVNENGLRTIYI